MARRRRDATPAAKRPATTHGPAPIRRDEWPASGLCAQAQADGVPCAELGKKCESCEHADARFAR